jgi:aminoglycoside phosphotransferase (APT) family kinase protein
VTEDEAARLVALAFPELAPITASALGSGLDNAAFLVNEAMVFRFPRRPEALVFLEHEIRVAPRLAPLLPLPIAAPRWVAAPSAAYAHPFVGHPYIAGATGEALLATDAIATSVARFLRALHDSAPEIEGEPPGDVMHKSDPARALERVERWVAGHRSERAVCSLAKELARAAPARAKRWVHGDLYPRHLVIEHGALAGVIDWGDVHLGDPALDLSVAVAWLPSAFFEAYGEVDRDTLDRARLRALGYGTYFVGSDDAELRALGERYLERLLG